jgi:hypothetical protein
LEERICETSRYYAASRYFCSMLAASAPPLTHHMHRNGRTDVTTFSMDAQRDIKPFFPSTATAGIERGGLHGASTSHATALLLGRGGARGVVGVLPPQQQAACVLNRASSDLSGGDGDRSCPEEGLDSTSARRPCSVPKRICRNFWSAGDYDAAAGRSTRQPQSTSYRYAQVVPVVDSVRT